VPDYSFSLSSLVLSTTYKTNQKSEEGMPVQVETVGNLSTVVIIEDDEPIIAPDRSSGMDAASLQTKQHVQQLRRLQMPQQHVQNRQYQHSLVETSAVSAAPGGTEGVVSELLAVSSSGLLVVSSLASPESALAACRFETQRTDDEHLACVLGQLSPLSEK